MQSGPRNAILRGSLFRKLKFNNMEFTLNQRLSSKLQLKVEHNFEGHTTVHARKMVKNEETENEFVDGREETVELDEQQQKDFNEIVEAFLEPIAAEKFGYTKAEIKVAQELTKPAPAKKK